MKFLNCDKKLYNLAEDIKSSLYNSFKYIEHICALNENKVLNAFLKCKIGSAHFVETTGYGYGDIGKEKLNLLYSKIFCSEDALVSSGFVSGTHTIAVVLFGLLRPKDVLLCVTGRPYPTILKTIGINRAKNKNSLIDCGVNYKEIDILNKDEIDLELLKKHIKDAKMVYIQRSKGYSSRRSLSVEDIEKIATTTHNINKDAIVFVDNCYGEFVQEKEPTEVGADIACGSLIKNPGGGIAKSGGYIVGKKSLIDCCADRLTAPGLGREVGCNMNSIRNIFLGMFLAPLFVSNALKVSIFARSFLKKLGFNVSPKTNEKMTDIVSMIEMGSKKKAISFCEGIQKYSPIDSFCAPIPGFMPGYNTEVIMAAGTFVNGASLELSADGEIKPPYNIFLQGGLTYGAAEMAIIKTVEKMVNEKLIKL